MILNDLIENVANYPLEAGTVAYLVDTEGTVVAHSGMDLFALEEGPLSLDYSGRPLVQAIVAGEKGGSLRHDHDGRPYFGSYVTLESNGWGVVVEAPMSSILAASEALAKRLLVVNIALFAMALGVTLVFARQITVEQRRAEKALRMREQAITTSITPFAIGDPEGKLTYVNPALVRLWGYDEEAEVLGKPATDFWLRKEEAAEVIAALQKEGFWRGEMVARRKDGSAFTADVSASVVVDATGAPICLASSFIDTTQRVRAEAELRESQERFALFMHHLPAAVYLKDAEGHILFLNEYFEKLFQRRADECLGKTDFDLFPADVAQQFREADQQVLAEGKPVDSIEQVPQEDGLHTYIAYKFPLLREGVPVLLGGISLDITARVRAEEKLKQTVAELERTNAKLERFNRLAVGRELRMIELKRQVNELAEQLGKEAPYDLSFVEE
jgi:PAS domain S-box-containing protein